MDGIKLVSIIVPVYGVETYLSDCVDSLLAQTYRNLEIILIDDSSPDGCAEICDQYAQKDARVKVIHKKNGGAASARNAGLDAVTGDCVCFVDADDMVEKEYVEHLLTALLEADADIAVCGYYDLTRTQRRVAPCQKPGIYSQVEYLSCFLKDWSCSLLWNKLYRREVIGALRMTEGHKIDDEFFTYRIVMNSHKIIVTDTPMYGYRMRSSSVMNDILSNGERILLDKIEYIRVRYADVAERYPVLEQAFLADAVDSMVRHWRRSYNSPKAQAEIRKWVNAHVGKMLTMKMPIRLRLAYLYHLYCRKPKALPGAEAEKTDLADYFE